MVEMQWGQQPVRLSAWRRDTLPTDAPTTSVHIVAFHGERVLVVRDRKGVHGFPGGRLESGETHEQALAREVYEEARAHLKPGFSLFAVLKIEYTERIAGRDYPHAYSYMGMYVGAVRALEPIGLDPAGIITARDLFSCGDCTVHLPEHDTILLREALAALARRSPADKRPLRAFSGMVPRPGASA
jgi:ADP-ribose pyrophosphatase YjhB (NUDIX family)